jgi:hypothetical protein
LNANCGVARHHICWSVGNNITQKKKKENTSEWKQ